VPIIILVFGVVLWWPPEWSPTRKSDLGAALVSGALVSMAVLFIERRQQRESEKRNMQLSLSTQQELEHMDLSNHDLRWVSFLRGRNLSRANFQGAKLSGADFSDALIDEGNFKGADLRHTNFAGCCLRKAKLSKADLRRANFSGAELDGAELYGADIRGANFGTLPDTVVEEMSIEYAFATSKFIGSLIGGLRLGESIDESAPSTNIESLGTPAKNLGAAKLVGAWYNASTKWPPEVDPENSGAFRLGGLRTISLSIAYTVSRVAKRAFRRLLFGLLRYASSPAGLGRLLVKVSGLASILGGVGWLLIMFSTDPQLVFGYVGQSGGKILETVNLVLFFVTVPLSMVGLVAFYTQRRERYGRLAHRAFQLSLVGVILFTLSEFLLLLYFHSPLSGLSESAMLTWDNIRGLLSTIGAVVIDIGLLVVGVAALKKRKLEKRLLERNIGGVIILAVSSDLLGIASQILIETFGYEALVLRWVDVVTYGVFGTLYFAIGYLLWSDRPVVSNAEDDAP